MKSGKDGKKLERPSNSSLRTDVPQTPTHQSPLSSARSAGSPPGRGCKPRNGMLPPVPFRVSLPTECVTLCWSERSSGPEDPGQPLRYPVTAPPSTRCWSRLLALAGLGPCIVVARRAYFFLLAGGQFICPGALPPPYSDPNPSRPDPGPPPPLLRTGLGPTPP
jgi:hypothetical protein